MDARLDRLADQILLLIGRFLLAFVVCLYVRVGFGIATHCEAGQGFWCAGAILYSPLGLLADLAISRPDVNRAVSEFSVASVIVTLVWTGAATLLRLRPPTLAMAVSLKRIANSGWFLLGLFGRLVATFTACLIIGAALLMAPHCLNDRMCILLIPLVPLLAFNAPPGSMDAGLPAMLPGIWIATLLGTVIWTIAAVRRRRQSRGRSRPE